MHWMLISSYIRCDTFHYKILGSRYESKSEPYLITRRAHLQVLLGKKSKIQGQNIEYNPVFVKHGQKRKNVRMCVCVRWGRSKQAKQ